MLIILTLPQQSQMLHNSFLVLYINTQTILYFVLVPFNVITQTRPTCLHSHCNRSTHSLLTGIWFHQAALLILDIGSLALSFQKTYMLLLSPSPLSSENGLNEPSLALCHLTIFRHLLFLLAGMLSLPCPKIGLKPTGYHSLWQPAFHKQLFLFLCLPLTLTISVESLFLMTSHQVQRDFLSPCHPWHRPFPLEASLQAFEDTTRPLFSSAFSSKSLCLFPLPFSSSVMKFFREGLSSALFCSSLLSSQTQSCTLTSAANSFEQMISVSVFWALPALFPKLTLLPSPHSVLTLLPGC